MVRTRKKSETVDKKTPKKAEKVQHPKNAASKATSVKKDTKQQRTGEQRMEEQKLRRLEERNERDGIVFFKRPFLTFYYFIREVIAKVFDLLYELTHHLVLVSFVVLLLALSVYGYVTPGPHQEHIQAMEKTVLWYLWWIGLGVLSSVGFGSGLHTFLIYLGPHIAKVTLAAYECNSLDFPEPPYPSEITCPTDGSRSAFPITLWAIVSKVRWEALFWGMGTAIGELPPYFMARSARLSGHVPDDEDLEEFVAFQEEVRQNPQDLSLFDRLKLWTEQLVTRVGFFGILIFASIPNPLFDLAGMICGHSLIPFWTFFGATLIGKAIVKMHVQMLFVIVTFSEHHVEDLVNLLKKIPKYGEDLQAPFYKFLQEQKRKLHRNPGEPVEEQSQSLIQTIITYGVTLMILYFLISIVNSLAQSFHKRLCDRRRREAAQR
ncbi:unnamed protein product [Bursaphelenchus okinawaensis]|uniref:Vacuole membrane protein 1 n=1 Tax=Bursaphelenchus okinawaensis TaxID=465554 RepID=A0A811KHW3_9BILA|nr:unnamed protein product [Bursaphelenchus okinawaensis]CAG9103379.1 unnamed protein product [Bursaphelenchus okinawaensis]